MPNNRLVPPFVVWCAPQLINKLYTRMHSSRMRIARSSSRGESPSGTPREQAPPKQAPPQEQIHTPWDQAPPGADTPLQSRHPSPGADTPRTRHPPLLDRHTPVNILPCPKLRLRAVIKSKCIEVYEQWRIYIVKFWLRAPPGGPNSFNFMQFLGNFGEIVCWRPPGSWRPLLGEILDPPLMRTFAPRSSKPC